MNLVDDQHVFESTPLIANGVLYGSGTFSVVFAIDAKTGQYKWRFDPEVPRSFTSHVCCGPETRGLAMYNGKIYVATLDGRLIALDQETPPRASNTPNWRWPRKPGPAHGGSTAAAARPGTPWPTIRT